MEIYEEDVDEFLEHFGVRGMKWGTRRARATSVSDKARPKRQKLAIGGTAAVAGLTAVSLAGNRGLRAPLVLAAGVGGVLGGAKLARAIIDRDGKKKVSDLS